MTQSLFHLLCRNLISHTHTHTRTREAVWDTRYTQTWAPSPRWFREYRRVCVWLCMCEQASSLSFNMYLISCVYVPTPLKANSPLSVFLSDAHTVQISYNMKYCSKWFIWHTGDIHNHNVPTVQWKLIQMDFLLDCECVHDYNMTGCNTKGQKGNGMDVYSSVKSPPDVRIELLTLKTLAHLVVSNFSVTSPLRKKSPGKLERDPWI